MQAPQETVANARRLRRNLSPPEARLWNRPRAPTVDSFRHGGERLAAALEAL
jgi:very-short-patch-repair endonuclease